MKIFETTSGSVWNLEKISYLIYSHREGKYYVYVEGDTRGQPTEKETWNELKAALLRNSVSI